MTRKIIAILSAMLLMLVFAACGEKEETKTLTGMVVSVDGTTISLMETDGNMGGSGNFPGMGAGGNFPGMGGSGSSQRPQMPEGMEGFDGFEGMDMENFPGFGNFNPEDFQDSMPEGGSFPQWGSGELPDGMTMPEGGQMPNFGDMEFDREEYLEDMETQTLDLSDAHISVEIDGGKASGSMEDIKAGAFVTVTVNGKGKVTNVLVSSRSGFSGNWFAN